MENNHDIDKKFNDALQALEEPITFPGFEKVWNKIEEKLEKKDNKKFIPIWLPYGVAASLVLAWGAFYFVNKKDAATPMITENAGKTGNIQQIDRTIQANIRKEIKKTEREEQKIIANEDIETSSKANGFSFKLQVKEIKTTTDDYPEKNNVTKTIKQELTDTSTTRAIQGAIILAHNEKRVPLYPANSIVASRNIKQHYSSVVLQGRVAGIHIAENGGKRLRSRELKNNVNNSGPDNDAITIRGNSSINVNTPMYVINGKISGFEALNLIDAKKIESLNVLKGPQATALYGSMAEKGVIVVQTKKLSKKEKRRIEKFQEKFKLQQILSMESGEAYDAFVENPFEFTKSQPLSTFSIDVDNAAYSNIRRIINNGLPVNKNAVRIEEMINYFKYSYPQPKNGEPFSINTEYNNAPWNSGHKLLKIGLQGKSIPTDNLPASNLVFLIDVSGSMEAPNKLPLLKASFKILLNQLRPQDKVGIVVYAGSAGMVLEPTSAKEKDKIINALDNLQAGGSTAGGAGIELAYKLAEEHFVTNGNNRVIIATDGDFNVGVATTTDLQTLIEEKRKSGVFLTCLGFGMGNYKDNMLETLADKGNGNYAYIDNLQEASRFLGKEFAGNIYTIAKDVKIQLEFNPKYVQSYRLIGYENRKLRDEDFVNDKIDAGELGSGHTVTALYEVVPMNVESEFLPKENKLKYSSIQNTDSFGDELATIKLRYKEPDGDVSKEISRVVKYSDSPVAAASPDFKFVSSVAWFGLVLRKSELIKDKSLSHIENLAKQGKYKDEEGYRAEFIRLIESYKAISK